MTESRTVNTFKNCADVCRGLEHSPNCQIAECRDKGHCVECHSTDVVLLNVVFSNSSQAHLYHSRSLLLGFHNFLFYQKRSIIKKILSTV